MVGSLLFSLLPVLVGMGMHAADCYNFLMEEDEEEREHIAMWQVTKSNQKIAGSLSKHSWANRRRPRAQNPQLQGIYPSPPPLCDG